MEEEERQEKIRQRIKAVITFLSIVIISILIIVIGNNKFNIEKKEDVDYTRAQITSVFVSENDAEEELGIVTKDISFEAKITEKGEDEDKIIFGRQLVTNVAPVKVVQEGNKVLLTKGESSEIYSFIDYDKSQSILILVIVFVILTIIVGFWKGLNTIIALILNASVIFLVYIPSIVSGVNIYLSTSLLALYVVTSGLILLNGINRKTFAAIIGNICGIVVTATLAIVLNKVFMITGVLDQESIFLQTINQEKTIDLVGIIWAGIVIGALGAIMDTAMSVSSTIREVSVNMENKDFKTLFNSGMNVGRDAIGTMTNTLVLAYIGGAISMTILLVANSKNYIFLLNSEHILVEILQAIVGSIGILVTVPFTVLIATLLELKKKKDGRKFVQRYSEGLSLKVKKDK